MEPWLWQSLPLKNRTGSQIFAQLFAQEAQATLLESPYPLSPKFGHLTRYSICAGAPRPQRCWTPPLGTIFNFLAQFPVHENAATNIPSHLPFQGGWLGWLGYDLAWEIEKLPQIHSDILPFPVAYWYEPATFAVLDHDQQVLWLATTTFEQQEYLVSLLNQGMAVSPRQLSTVPLSLQYSLNQAQYQTRVVKAQEYIRRGDIFQANLSLRFEALASLASWPVYQRLQNLNPSPFASYWRSPWGDIVSCSPERLVQVLGEQVQTRPIAGTRPRGINAAEDERLCQELRNNLKERAEHIMLVDLERNDLGRICRWGTVEVDELLAIERYSHVLHLVSNVRGKLSTPTSPSRVIRALFPGGTITGCPKVRCLEIIEELEPVRRSLFYGSCGYLDWRGNLDLNILIRTLLFTGGRVIGQVGAGIVADSDPCQEWFESLQKAQAQIQALGGAKI